MFGDFRDLDHLRAVNAAGEHGTVPIQVNFEFAGVISVVLVNFPAKFALSVLLLFAGLLGFVFFLCFFRGAFLRVLNDILLRFQDLLIFGLLLVR
jgi:hypothetical protein